MRRTPRLIGYEGFVETDHLELAVPGQGPPVIGEGTLLDGRYRLGPMIGRGGMSVVHAGDDLQLGRSVAIKLLHPGADATLAERLFREARAAARTQHPAVVMVFAHGTDPRFGVEYLVLERLSGENLSSRIKRDGAQPVSFVRWLGLELADALGAVHAAGVIHRDLKPANIFLARRGSRPEEVKLLDFGVARQLDLHTLTEQGELLGTLPYMAPEQVRNAHGADARVDVYALGAVLYECLSGARLTQGALPELLLAALTTPRPPLRSLRADVPEALVQAVERCLRPAPEERFASAEALRRALQ